MCGEISVHKFKESLAFSHEAEDLPIWKDVYKKAFPGLQEMVSHRADGWWQRAGIDRSLILSDSKQIKIDEKVRGRNRITGKVYGDILLEFYSSFESKTPGWVCKPLLADYIAYLIAPLGVCYLLPVIQLQNAWQINGEQWRREYRLIVAKNQNYTTHSIGVPPSVLYPAIGQELRISFEAFEIAQ